MIHIKTEEEIKIMKEGGKILAEILEKVRREAKPGITTEDLDKLAYELILFYAKNFPKAGIKPAFLGYQPYGNDDAYPASLCTSVNEEVVHCVPSDRMLKEGDILSLDFGIVYKDFNVDMAVTVNVGKISQQAKELIGITRKALEKGINQVKPQNTLGDIGYAIQKFVESKGLNVVRDLVGHGIGKELHEEPQVPNYGQRFSGVVLEPGMVIAIEPMVTNGSYEVIQDGFSWKTKDGSLSVHFEHTVAVTKNGNVVLTK